jgi:mercuric ion binding protein
MNYLFAIAIIIGVFSGSGSAMETNPTSPQTHDMEQHSHTKKKVMLHSSVTPDATPNNSTKTYDIDIEVTGMVCSFCAHGIQKSFERHPAIDDVHVNLDASSVRLNLKADQQIQDNDIKTIITDSGYNIGSIKRNNKSKAKTK